MTDRHMVRDLHTRYNIDLSDHSVAEYRLDIFTVKEKGLDACRDEMLAEEADLLMSDLIAFMAIGIPRGKELAILCPSERFKSWYGQEDNRFVLAMTLERLVLIDSWTRT